ncbi:DUF2271 domain-containing protein [Parahaliea aestuarii]|uniref:DUF2271 domain-containing protein n=1 Tax=Parahaliea aestuarii TaxID=1852021 RepID=A0A5C9A1N2_9GAMM|nr:DUF2271 domain-containing protein [Parahaliea aestuarii]TXS93261.1 DUF2271 domain-containing protein [Parahaliea aestuarii]
MLKRVTRLLPLSALALAGAVQGQTLEVDLGIPRLQVAEYHKPYVALWVAREDNSVAANLAVLYDVELKDEEGEKWLKDMRQWWRRSGRSLDMPIDGLSGATKGPGEHRLVFSDRVADLAPGEYRLMVEAAREVGGREMLEVPFQWPPQKTLEAAASGDEELATVKLILAP